MTQPGRKSSASKLVVSAIGTPTRIKAPPELTESEREVFADIVSSLEPDHFRVCDLPLLVAYCRAAVMEKRAGRELDREPLQPNGQINPWSTIHSNAVKTLVSLSMRLRISPQGRREKVSSKPPRAVSVYERMAIAGLMEGDGDEANGS